MPETGIVDYRKVAAAYGEKVRDANGDIRLSQRVVGILDRGAEIVLQTSGGDYRTKNLINCGGLQSDIVAQMMGASRITTAKARSTASSRSAASITKSPRRANIW